jgi:tRNA nucleotidyltransferase (CCA-adding enzyme)
MENRAHIQPDLEQRLRPELWTLLQTMARSTQERGWQLYLVGGVVRDLLLATDGGQLSSPDLDLVVDGGNDHRAGVELATALHELYPTAQLKIHGKFQTAALEWDKDPILGNLSIDIATARTESYAYPAANPDVIASSIRADLYRRDFTVNALTIRLTQPQAGELFDFFGGLVDLEAKQLRVLHPDSFIDDPTRIYRGMRFAVRLGFAIESQTQSYIKEAIASDIYERTLATYPKVPALQTRLKAELKYIFQTDYWFAILERLDELDALKCLHPNLKLDLELKQRLQSIDSLIQSTNLPRLSPWLIRLEILLTGLTVVDRIATIEQLQLPPESLTRLSAIDRSHQELIAALSDDISIGQIVRLLQPYDRILLLSIAIIAESQISSIVQQYLTTWIHIKPPIDGRDLKSLGYKPGKQYQQILDTVLIATLDGIITDREGAIEFVRKLGACTERLVLSEAEVSRSVESLH